MEFRVCSGEIPPCSFETARRLNCEETQIMNCYLYMIANYANDTYNHKYYVVNAWAIISGFLFHWNLSSSLKFEGKAQLNLKFEWRTQIWVTNSNLSETVWYPPDLSEPSNLSDHPELRESRQITQNWVLHLFLRAVIYLVYNVVPHTWSKKLSWKISKFRGRRKVWPSMVTDLRSAIVLTCWHPSHITISFLL